MSRWGGGGSPPLGVAAMTGSPGRTPHPGLRLANIKDGQRTNLGLTHSRRAEVLPGHLRYLRPSLPKAAWVKN
jgi:hypothetical protein